MSFITFLLLRLFLKESEMDFRSRFFFSVILSGLFFLFTVDAFCHSNLKERIRTYRQSHDHIILREFFGFLSIPNVASDKENFRKNAQHLMMMMGKRGIKTHLLESPSGQGAPAVYGELQIPGAKRTIMIYAHYDGQPADLSKWIESNPWQPVLRNESLEAAGKIIPLPEKPGTIPPLERIYARSSSDDKAPIIAMLAALDGLYSSGMTPTVNLKFFFDGEEEELEAFQSLPDFDKNLMSEFGISTQENVGKSLGELILLPSLTINGISSAHVGAQARTIVPSTATTRIDMPLVKENDPQRQFEKLKVHIQKIGYFIVDSEPTDQQRLSHSKIARVTTRGGYKAFRTSMSDPFSKEVCEAVQSVSDLSVVQMPTLGGSVPISFIPDISKAPVIGIPIVNHDNNQHSENENLRFQNLWDGIEIMAALMRLE